MSAPKIKLSSLLLAALAFIMLMLAPGASYATCANCGTIASEHAETQSDTVIPEHDETRKHITDEIDAWEEWLTTTVEERFIPSFQRVGEEMTAAAVNALGVIGGFFDAQQQMDVQRALQLKTAEAYKDYHPSEGMCVFGTNTKSLAATQSKGELNSFALNKWAMDRQLGSAYTSAAEGAHIDRYNRLLQFREFYCSAYDNGGQLGGICPDGPSPATDLYRDIDFTSVIDSPLTINFDLTDTSITNEERNVFALSSNLYGQDIMLRIPENLFTIEKNKPRVINARALAAKRNVAQTSFNKIVGMKSAGTELAKENRPYLQKVLAELGVPEIEAGAMLGDSPSYHAQMEVLTRRIYQSPSFYVDLYDKPTNVLRKKVTMQALDLMQNYDSLESYLRTEMMLSLILESELTKLQAEVQNKLNSLGVSGETRR